MFGSATKTATSTFECGSCFAETTGYTWTELTAEGWKCYENGKFYMCSDCEREYADRRMARALAAEW